MSTISTRNSEGLNPQNSNKAELSPLESLTKTPSYTIEVKSYVGDSVIAGGKHLQDAFTGLQSAFSPVNKMIDYYFPPKSDDTKLQEHNDKVEIAKAGIDKTKMKLANISEKITGSESNTDQMNKFESEALREHMIKGQNLCTRAVFFNTAMALIGGAAGAFAGMYLSHVGGAAGAALGALGGMFIGYVAGHIAGKSVANYLLKGMGIDEKSDEHKNVKLLVTCTFCAVGGVIGLGCGLIGGGAVGAFLGELCIVGGLTKAGLGLGWLAGAATLGNYLDSHGKACQEAVKDRLAKEGFTYDAAPIAPSVMDKAATVLTDLSNLDLAKVANYINGKTDDTNEEATNNTKSTSPSNLIKNMNKLLELDTLSQSPATAALDKTEENSNQLTPPKGGSMIQSLYGTCNSVYQNLVLKPAVFVNKGFEVLEKRTERVRDEREKRYDTWTGATERVGEDGKLKAEGNAVKYHRGARICALSIAGRVTSDLAGIGVGLLVGTKLLAVASPVLAVSATAAAIGGGVEGAVTGFVGGYLLAEWLSGESSVNTVIEMQYKEQQPALTSDFKNTSEYKDFKKEKMEAYHKDDTDYQKAKAAVWTGAALSMGAVGSVIGLVGTSMLRGGEQAFILKGAVLGGSVKVSMMAFDFAFGASLHHMYCCGSALEKANAPENMVNIIQLVKLGENIKSENSHSN